MNILWKLILKKQKNKLESPEGGFITLEILVSMLMATLFLLGTLQMVVVGLAISVGATKEQRADKIIQQEVENLNDLGSNLTLANMDAACSGTLNIDGNGATADDGFGQALWNLRQQGDPLNDMTVNPFTFNDTTIGGRILEVRLTRNNVAGEATLSPHRVLGLTFRVAEDLNSDGDTDDVNEVITNRYVEMIPDAALECP